MDKQTTQLNYELNNSIIEVNQLLIDYLTPHTTEQERHILLPLYKRNCPASLDQVVAGCLHTFTKSSLPYETPEQHYAHSITAQIVEAAITEILTIIELMVITGKLKLTETVKGTILYSTIAAAPDNILQRIKQLHAVLPMMVHPQELFRVGDNPYLFTHYKNNVCRQKITSDTQLNLTHLNRMNAIPMRIEPTALAYQAACPNLPATEDIAKYYTTLTHYFTYYYDGRGRTYCNGYYLTTQGTDWHKAVSVIDRAYVIPLD